MTDLPKVTYPLTDSEIIILSLILAFIATVIFNFLYMIIRKFVELFIDSYRIINEFKRQLEAGEITLEEYNCKVSKFGVKCKSGEIDRNTH